MHSNSGVRSVTSFIQIYVDVNFMMCKHIGGILISLY